MGEKKQARIRVARQCTMIFGAVVLTIGLFSYYESATARKYDIRRESSDDREDVKFDKYCEHLKEQYPDEVDSNMSCPNLSLELYFISGAIICFIISWLGLLASGLSDFKKFKFLELGANVIAAALMIIGGIVYIIFAGQVSTMLLAFNNGDKDIPIDPYNDFKIMEKRLAGALAIVQALQFGYAAAMAGMQ